MFSKPSNIRSFQLNLTITKQGACGTGQIDLDTPVDVYVYVILAASDWNGADSLTADGAYVSLLGSPAADNGSTLDLVTDL